MGSIDCSRDPLILSSLLRLGTKYEVSHLREKSLAALESLYPVDLKLWKLAETLREVTLDKRANSPAVLFLLANAVDASQAHSFLPTLLFLCANNSMQEILDGAEYGGTNQKLEVHLQRAVLIARPTLHRMARDILLAPFLPLTIEFVDEASHTFIARRKQVSYKWGEKCNKDTCARQRVIFWMKAVNRDYLGGCILSVLREKFAFSLCADCEEELQEKTNSRARREKSWKSLPKIFGLVD